MSKIKLSNLLVVLVVLELWVKDYLVDHFPELVSINPGVAFGLGDSSTSLWGVVLLAILAILQRLRPFHVWLGLIIVVILNAIERWRFGGAVDYLQIGTLQFNLSDIAIIGLVMCLLVTWQQKNGSRQ